MLPYFEVHGKDNGPTSPLRWTPFGKTYRLPEISSFQSIERAVMTVFSGPLYTTLVQDSYPFQAPDARMNMRIIEGNFFIVILFEVK
jgi:hypothetical protein